jgi:nucleolar complex protein 3
MGKRSGTKKKDKKNKVILPPELPPEVDDDEVYVSEEDIDFYDRHRFPTFDQKSIDRLVPLGLRLLCAWPSPAPRIAAD